MNLGIKILVIFFLGIVYFSFAINIISRSQRGADESLKYSSNPYYKKLLIEQQKYIENLKKHKTLYEKYLQKQHIENIRNQYLIKHRSQEFKIDKIVKQINGQNLWRPLQYHYNKTKIVIHHTTNDLTKYKSPEDVKKLLRAIYRRHALKRGWGDIGYNYVIGPFGYIYEGRYGGDGIIGAHAKRNNPASIGIALIGNFNIQKPTKKQINSLIQLLTWLCQKYNINPLQDITWHKPIIGPNARPPYMKDILLPSIVGHRDINPTQCPGQNLYELLPWIRKKVWENLQKNRLISTTSHNTKKTYKKYINLDKWIFIKNNSLTLPINIPSQPTKCYTNDTHFQITNCKKQGDKVYLSLKWSKFLASGKKKLIIETKDYIYEASVKLLFKQDLDYYLHRLKQSYISKHHPYLAKHKIKKIQYKISLEEAKKLLSQNIAVLLYQLSTDYNTYQIKCEPYCEALIDQIIPAKNIKTIKIIKNSSLLISINNKKPIQAKSIFLSGKLIIFENYNRKSYAGIPWNSFKNNIIIKKDYIKLLNSQILKQYVVINKLPIQDYLKGIAETNDQMPFEKNKALALIIKDYTIFYMKNKHPNIPQKASYHAIDDVRIFQKYVGAGFEKTSKSWQEALQATQNEIITYQGWIPILPYFNCSPGFTWSAEEKFGWTDTPYLQSQLDFAKCDKFYGHGVGLSGKGAEILAKKGLDYKKILKRYYKGIKIEKIK